MSKQNFGPLKKVINKFLTKGSTASVRSKNLDTRVQGFAVPPDVILAEMRKSYSPFQREEMKGIDLSKASKDVSDDLWRLLKSTPKAVKVYVVAGGKIPTNFLYGDEKAVAYDDTLRVMYHKGKKGATGTSFRSLSTILTDVKKVTKTYPPTHYTRLFLNPNQEWLDHLEFLKDKLQEEDPDLARTGKAMQTRLARRIESGGSRTLPQFKGTNQEGQALGHTFGAGATNVASFLENSHDIQSLDLDKPLKLISSIPADFHGAVSTIIKEVFVSDTNIEYERKFDSKGGTARLTITVPEDAIANKVSGNKLKAQLKLLDELSKEILRTIKLEELEGSPSYNALLKKYIEDVFLGKKPSSKTYRSNLVIRGKKTKVVIPVAKISSSKVSVDESKARSKVKNEGDLHKILALLNSKLHDKIRENMGKGTSKQKLNYRTGRFAKSARVESLSSSREKNALNARVKYMRNPYGVFEVGGRLNPPKLRDPAGIFGRSIRQILQEEKIANLRRVKVQLSG